jgi:alkyl sulfatase BDS1-like metallo-beta-lactamase superfamily hydrolase
MREVRLPDHFDVGEAYGKVSWNVRAIWEMYAGWFHHRSTTELYGVPPWAVVPDIVSAAGPEALVAAAAAREEAGEHLEAIHLTELVLSLDAGNTDARRVASEAHERLLAEADNFWERAWLRHAIDQLTVDPLTADQRTADQRTAER